ncbi:AAA family ATPase [Pontibacillus marinus]|uniref:ABC transporter domain-containing protein n=1 Tax=Pontibacillus marinus BH030004 = DSM 16465 TaxID=1385511 RepID=A0A0A5FYR5_9BACI|nr:AAA family ATPase [Pontibacillus marinus]KGX83945.1 hypothetical protein N783_20495 [Pontibacillus marinus BH030004 = DSM 16465]
MLHLKSVQYKQPSFKEKEFPFSLSLFRQLDTLSFEKSITILVGENGTGKSTLLESMAFESDSILIGGEMIDQDPTLQAARKIAPHLDLTWHARTKSGFFFRAEDFRNYVQKVTEYREDAEQQLERIRREDPHSYEVLPYARTIGELNNLYGDGLDVRSHGESFLDLFKARLRPNSFYILDEPEAPLSPLKQLSLISLIMDSVREGSQFIIATHSPMLMALPEAELLSIEDGELIRKSYEELEHVKLTKDFLNHPEQFLRHL